MGQMEPQLPEALSQIQDDLDRLPHKKEGRMQSVQVSSSVDALQSSIDELLLMFKRANEELTLEQREEQIMKSQLDPILKKLQDLSEQQETIANAIVTVSDAIDTLTTSVNEIKTRMAALEITATAPRLPPMTMPQNAGRPSYQRFEFGHDQQNQLPPPPPANSAQPPQAIPSLSPNELGEKKKFF